ncbi:MAG TPA: bifunctional riboflavin kinase/FAD synthetase [Anaerolineaceae bacterium]|nr:bifunctional riboflavin kinase/FAD synthetase [Anaerolineaceae bacterium]
MQHLRGLEAVKLDGSWVTIGSFDGVHLGHQSIIRRLVAGAHADNLPAIVITFFPHPSKVLRGNGAPFYLTTPEERAAILSDLDVDFAITLTFDKELASHTADEFIGDLWRHLSLKHLLVGHDFALGRGREGNFDVLGKLSQKYGYSIEEFVPFMIEGEVVSSSRIREMINEGNVRRASQYLGRFYDVEGKVVPGDGRGRTIGIPTANLEIWKERLLPGRGVYATLADYAGKTYPSVTNIGLRPTFENQSSLLTIETHLLGLSQDLYGSFLKLEFVEFLRSEQRFPSVQALVDQIHSDIDRAKGVLSHVS